MRKTSQNNQSMKFSKNIRGISGFLILISLLSGCGMWTNFKTYFNTYYNANEIFVETEEKVLNSNTELFSFEELPISNNLSKKFDQVIEKTSAILQHAKESSYVEEALLMTGKSFYYQQNYSRALRKFNELAGIEESELALENKLWIAKTQLQLREFNKSINTLDEVKAEANQLEEEEISIEAYKTKVGYLIYSEQYEDALTDINDFMETNISDELKASVLYEMGLLYKEIEDFELAEQAFAQVTEYSPTFETEFSSRFEAAKMKGELGEIDTSQILLEELRSEDKFSDNWGEIDLEIGKIHYDKNEIELAFDKFTEVDTTYQKTEAAGIAGFYRAEILENHYQDYDSALVFYKSSSHSAAPQEIRSIAQKKSGQLNKYLSYHKKLKDLKTQLLYLTDEDAFLSDSLDYVEKIKQDSIRTANLVGEQPKGRTQTNQNNSKHLQPKRPIISADSIHALNSKNYFELANLLFSEFDDPDSAYFYYKLSLIEKEENPNQAQTYFAIGNYFLEKGNNKKADSLFTLVYDKFKYDRIRNEAAKKIGKPLYDFDKDPVEDEYVKAEAIYDSSNYNGAITQLYKIYNENPTSIYASKSLYTIGFILENDLKMPDSAASVYDTLTTKYRSSEYAKSVQIKLTGHKQEERRLQAIQDSIKKAQEVNLDSLKTDSEIQKEVLNIDGNERNVTETEIKDGLDSKTQKPKINPKEK